MNAFPLLLVGGAAAYFLTKKKPTRAIGGDDPDTGGTGGTGGDDPDTGGTGGTGGAEPAIGDTVAFSKTPQGEVMWKVIRSPGGYMARWTHYKENNWQSLGEFATPGEAIQRISDSIVMGKIP